MKTPKNKYTTGFLLHIAFVVSAFLFSNNLSAQEICNNGIDDDGNGQIDLNDTACRCNLLNLVPNSSFEDTNCCPSTYSQMNCSKSWVQASSTTSDYMNTCGFVFGAMGPAGLLPFPDGNGIVGCIFAPTWQEYVGTCLNSSLLKDSLYTFQLSVASTPIDGFGNTCNGGIINYGPIDLTLWGVDSCIHLPFSGTGCPPSPWVVLGTVNYVPSSTWATVNISFVPGMDINAIIIGSPCVLPSDYVYGPCYPYFYFDKLVMTKNIGYVPNSITQTGSWCTNDIVLTAQPDTGITYQWYNNGIAISGAITPTLNVSASSLPPGGYQLVVQANVGGTCHEYYKEVLGLPVSNAGRDTILCEGGTVNLQGINSSLAGITSYSWVGPNAFISSMQNPSITNIQTFQSGNYILTVMNSDGCSSKDTVHVAVNTCGTYVSQLQNFQQLSIYPNPGNGQIIVSNAQIISEVKVINAFGQIIYESRPGSRKINFNIENPGVYFVIVKAGNQSITRKLIVN
ncbi:MAG: T9SS type A sorting domain-containing protein [Bacteroidia bacterium]